MATLKYAILCLTARMKLYGVRQTNGKRHQEKICDFYAKLTSSGRLILVGIAYTSEGLMGEEYFSKDLKSAGADCYTLGFEVAGSDPYGVADPIDLIAVPCEDRRHLQ